jgi:acyl dehydratase
MSDLSDLVGSELGPTPWLELTQERVNLFAEATGDHQWIHVDPEAAAAGPFGTTIGHGFLSLSLLVPFLADVLPAREGSGMGINYGLNKVRFISPLPVGSRIRARFRAESVEEVAGGEQLTFAATVEREGDEKPVLVAEWLVRYVR